MRTEPYRLHRTGYLTFWVKTVAFGLTGLLLLVSCGGSSSGLNPTATPQPSPTDQIAASPEPATLTPPVQTTVAAASSPAVSEHATEATGTTIPASTRESASNLPPGVQLATPIDERPIEKDVTTEPGGPIPTPRQSDFDLDKNGFYTYDELQTAVNTVYPTYQWPPNYHISAATILGRMTPNPAVTYNWEAGAEQTVIGIPHFCAWALTLRDTMHTDDTELTTQSIDQIRTVTLPNPMFIYIREYIESAVDTAELGDPADLQGQIDALHCNGIPWEEATPVVSGAQQIPLPLAQLVAVANLPQRWAGDLA